MSSDRQEQESLPDEFRKLQLFAVRTIGGRELDVALTVEALVNALKNSGREDPMSSYLRDIRAIIVPPEVKGYVIFEVQNLHTVYLAVRDIRHVKGRAAGSVSYKDLEEMIRVKPIIESLREKMVVEIIAGPFRGSRGVIQAIDKAREEVVVFITESQFPLTITLPAEFVRPVQQ
ncbi:MAG: transcription elongation factor Spt5 [Desulfurococcaceae archaeon]|nr:transcription elongation factor Spt5 [Desulfurococcaceae archaeon]